MIAAVLIIGGVGLVAALGVFVRDWLADRRRFAALAELEWYFQRRMGRGGLRDGH